MLHLPLHVRADADRVHSQPLRPHLRDPLQGAMRRAIRAGDYCACSAGQGSGCGGALA